MNDPIAKLIKMALAEDIGTGDVTTDAIIPDDLHAIGRIAAKQSLVLAGIDIAKRVFETVSTEIGWDPKRKDGERCEIGDVIAIIQGNAKALLKAERTAINFLQRLSGIATLTRKFVDAIKDTNAQIFDTRKTTPGYRCLDKYAVKMGGGMNHRMGLYDQYLIKNNHISVAGSIGLALKAANKAHSPGQLIEIEVRVIEEIKAAIDGGADIIMFDNMNVETVKRAVKMVGGRVKTEVSGNITLDNVRSYAECGIDFISVGSITHSAPAADIHMLTVIEKKAGEHSISSLEKS